MKANTQATDPRSWSYWTNIHLNRCPHSIPYFFAWHRGYLYYFERQLRAVSGDPQLILPYWDYYTNPTLPAELTNPSTGNPLYVSRVNNNVRQALSMAPFDSGLINFPTNSTNAFEPSFESAPHNLIHNIIGGVMADMLSPTDPIFWLHHANVDRLWVAWVSAGSGRKMPSLSSAYWSGSHIYTSSLTMPRSSTYSTRTKLGYRYQNESFPTRLPSARSALSTPDLAEAAPSERAGMQPPLGSFRISPTRQTSDRTFALSGALDVGLDERSIGVQLPVSSESMRALAQIGAGAAAALPASQPATLPFRPCRRGQRHDHRSRKARRILLSGRPEPPAGRFRQVSGHSHRYPRRFRDQRRGASWHPCHVALPDEARRICRDGEEDRTAVRLVYTGRR
jgi:tyrosinase